MLIFPNYLDAQDKYTSIRYWSHSLNLYSFKELFVLQSVLWVWQIDINSMYRFKEVLKLNKINFFQKIFALSLLSLNYSILKQFQNHPAYNQKVLFATKF